MRSSRSPSPCHLLPTEERERRTTTSYFFAYHITKRKTRSRICWMCVCWGETVEGWTRFRIRTLRTSSCHCRLTPFSGFPFSYRRIVTPVGDSRRMRRCRLCRAGGRSATRRWSPLFNADFANSSGFVYRYDMLWHYIHKDEFWVRLSTKSSERSEHIVFSGSGCCKS